MVEWHFGETASSQATMAEAIFQAKELNDMHGLGAALAFAGALGSLKRDAAEVDRVASDLTELVTAPYGGTRMDLMELIALAEAGTIEAERTYLPLDDAVSVYSRLEKGEIQGGDIGVAAPITINR